MRPEYSARLEPRPGFVGGSGDSGGRREGRRAKGGRGVVEDFSLNSVVPFQFIGAGVRREVGVASVRDWSPAVPGKAAKLEDRRGTEAIWTLRTSGPSGWSGMGWKSRCQA